MGSVPPVPPSTKAWPQTLPKESMSLRDTWALRQNFPSVAQIWFLLEHSPILLMNVRTTQINYRGSTTLAAQRETSCPVKTSPESSEGRAKGFEFLLPSFFFFLVK